MNAPFVLLSITFSPRLSKNGYIIFLCILTDPERNKAGLRKIALRFFVIAAHLEAKRKTKMSVPAKKAFFPTLSLYYLIIPVTMSFSFWSEFWATFNKWWNTTGPGFVKYLSTSHKIRTQNLVSSSLLSSLHIVHCPNLTQIQSNFINPNWKLIVFVNHTIQGSSKSWWGWAGRIYCNNLYYTAIQ